MAQGSEWSRANQRLTKRSGWLELTQCEVADARQSTLQTL